MPTILSIDQGTSGTKAVVVDDSGVVLGLAEVSVHPVYLSGGGVEQDPQELLASVLDSGRQALNLSGLSRVDAVSLANQGESVLAWDRRTGVPLTPIIVWQDRRAESLCQELGDYAQEIAQRTGLTLDPYFSAPKMAWVRRNQTREGVITTSDTWLVHQLSGAFVTDASTASRSLLLDVDSGDWDDRLLELFQLQGEELPQIVGSDEVVGTTSAFGHTAPLCGLIVDQQAALAAEHCLEPGQAKCTFGTGAFLLANTGMRAPRSESGLTTSIAWQVCNERTYCLDGQVYTAASAVRWMANLGLIDSAVELDSVAAADSDGVLAVTSLAGFGAPRWEPQATASVSGMTLSTGKGHVVRAVLEGIAAQVAEATSAMAHDLGHPLRSLRVDGGLTQSRVLMQAVADLTQLPVELYASQHATPLGAAAMARIALHPGQPVGDAVLPWRPSGTFEPAWPQERATEFLTRWGRAADNA